jgi:hypothetical protein
MKEEANQSLDPTRTVKSLYAADRSVGKRYRVDVVALHSPGRPGRTESRLRDYLEAVSQKRHRGLGRPGKTDCDDAILILPGRKRIRSGRSSALNQVNNEHNDGNHEQKMDQTAADVADKTQKPEHH